jgi:hypothetical protein
MAIEWTNKEDWNQSQDNTGIVHDSISDNSGHGSLQQGYKVGSLTEGLVAYYPMEKGSGGIAWDAAHDNHGKINGATWNGSGKVGSDSLNFNSSSESVQVSDNREVRQENNFSLSFWIKIDSWTSGYSWNPVQKHGGTGSSNFRFYLDGDWSTDDELGVYATNGGSWDEVAPRSKSLQLDNWYHVVWTYSNGGKLYIDGESQGSKTGSGNLKTATGEPIEIGNLEGKIDDFRIYNRPLSTQEVKALYNLKSPSGFKQAEDVRNGLKHEYKLDGDATDSVGGSDGTTNGSMAFTTGYRNQAASFDGSDDYIDTGLIYEEDTITVSYWVYRNGTSNVPWEVNNYGGTGSNQNHLIISTGRGSNNDTLGAFVDEGSNGEWITSSAKITDAQWQHVAASYNPDTNSVSFYLNGTSYETIEFSGTPPDFSERSFYLGRDRSGSSHYLNGMMDEVRFYNTALKPHEIEKIYRLGRRRIDRKEVLH